MKLPSRLLGVACATALGATVLAAAPVQAADDVTINLVGINDFHGRIDAATVQWAGTVKQLEADAPAGQSLLVSAGDNVSASLFASAVQDDNPTIDVLNALGLDASAAGNHEFDKGYADLVDRIIPRADFPILGANVTKAGGEPALDPSATFDVEGVKVAVVGAVTQETPALVSPAGIEGLTFGDPVAGINAEVARLDALPEAERPDVIVASFHEGAPDGTQTFAQAVQSSAVFRHLVEDTTADVDAIFMGHTHQKYAYDAPIPGGGGTRPVIQTGNYGENVGQIKLQVNPDTGAVSSYSLRNVARLTTADASLVSTYPDLAQVKQIRDAAVTYANQVGNVEKGQITGDITTAFVGSTRDDRASESSLGNLVADALLAKVGDEPAGADLALVNPGGLRADLKYAGTGGVDGDGVTTYAELNAVLPFANNLVSVRLSGASIKKLFEQQWQRDAAGNVPSRAYLQLGTSKNVSYTFDPTLPEGSRIQSLRIDGAEVDPAAQYKVATFSFLAAGGDNFRAFKEGVTTDTGLVDRDGWIQYFADESPIDPSYAKHAVQTTGVKAKYPVGGAVSYTLGKLDLTSLGTPAATRVVSKLVYEGGSKTLGTTSVSGGTSAPLSFALPDGVSGSVRVESTVYAGNLPVGTKVVVPLDVTGAKVSAEAGEGVAYGDDVPVAVTVSGPVGEPTGEVTLSTGDTVVGEGDLVDGQVTIDVDSTDLGAGASALTARYSGDGTYPAASGSVEVTIDQAATTTEATPPAAEVGLDEDADIDVTVTSETGTEPTGTVTVTRDGAAVGQGTLEDGQVTVAADLAGADVGDVELEVTYAGDDDHVGSSTTTTVDVVKGDPGLEATAEAGQYGQGAEVTVTADEGASGLVYLFDDTSTLVGMGLMKDGAATVTTLATALKPGDHDLTVAYAGSTSYDADNTTVAVTIEKGATTTTKTSVSPSKVVVKKTKAKVTFTVAATGFTPTGTVTVTNGGNFSTTVLLSSTGTATVTLPVFIKTGTKTVTATYSGSEVADGSTGTATITVKKK